MEFTFRFPWHGLFRGHRLPKRGRASKAKTRRPSRVPRVEVLEGRTLPSVLTVVNVNDSGPGSLRYEIAQAEDGDTIKFSKSLAGTSITLTTGEIAFDIGLDIEGLGAGKLSVSGGGVSRIFDIGPDASAVTIAGLTLKEGGGVDAGGAIVDDGAPLTLSRDTLKNDQALGAAEGEANVPAFGGALFVRAETTAGMAVTISNCRFVNDAAVGSPGGVFLALPLPGGEAQGGAIYLNAEHAASLDLTITSTSFTSDSATGGNGQDANADTGTVATSGGFAQGGAVYIDAGGAAQPIFSLSLDTFSKCSATGGTGGKGDNGSDGAGGGEADGGALFYTADFAAAPSLSVSSSVFSSNTALGGNGGAGGDALAASEGANGGNGGNGGSGDGGGVYADFQNSAAGTDTFSADSFFLNTGQGGNGGTGGFGNFGGNGGSAGDGIGGGLFLNVSGAAAATSLDIARSAIDSNVAQGGNGGAGGGGEVAGGLGGDGLNGFGGGVSLFGSAPSDTWTFDSDSIFSNFANAGNGGSGGAGLFGGNGGNSGLADGAGVIDEFLGTLKILHGTIEDNFAEEGMAGAGGAGLVTSGSNGLQFISEGGGIFIAFGLTACATPDTQISGNSANLFPDVAGELGTC